MTLIELPGGHIWGIKCAAMMNLNAVLNERISRISRRQIRKEAGTARKLIAGHRRDLAALKRLLAEIQRRLRSVEKVAGKGRPVAINEKADKARFRADGLASHRKRLGISAASYAKLVGVSPLTIYHWESGKARPRRSQLAKLLNVRGIGKREAQRRLAA